MVKVLGLDIGGANLKLTVIDCVDGVISKVEVFTEYFPIWRRGRENLPVAISNLIKRSAVESPDLAAITMTAELSDVYFSKTEGVHHIVDSTIRALKDVKLKFLNVHGELLSPEEAKSEPLDVAAANWYASGWLASKLSKDCLLVDTGSTSTSLVPVLNGRVAAKGFNDLEKLMNGELVYTGALRTNVAAIVSHVPVKGILTPVSSEFFAQSGDVHLMLGNIKPEDYTVDTPDGRGVSKIEVAARLARVVCADLDILSLDEIHSIASYIYRAQLTQIVEALNRLSESLNVDLRDKPAYTAGIGGEFLSKKALTIFGFKNVTSISQYIGSNAAKVVPSYALALMAVEFLEGREPKNWRLF
ncbi:MAG: hydantoinase/oxoprolinase family protein [Candidatus Bathyarchaeia archaeon]